MTATSSAKQAAARRAVVTGLGCWRAMIQRCTNPRSKDFAAYGGRGVTVCERWRESFAAFIADVGPRPTTRHSIDRFPVRHGNYEPGNVRWATPRQQSQNSDMAIEVELDGIVACVSEHARRRGVVPLRILTRLHHGWTVERAFGTPIRARYLGGDTSLLGRCRHERLSYWRVYGRVRRGMDVEDAIAAVRAAG